MQYILAVFSFLVFIFGLSIGSFLNCLIYRLEKEESILGRSYCPNCKHALSWKDLFPVLSYIFLSGKCRYCGKKISWQYPLVEISTGLIFVIIFLAHQGILKADFQFSLLYQGFGGQAIFNQFSIVQFLNILFLLYVVSSLIVIFVYDLKHYIIPDKVLVPAIVVTFLYQLFFNSNFLFFDALLSAIGTSLFFLLIFIISEGNWIGFGDVKLAILLGLILGFPDILVGLFLSFLLGALVGLVLIIFSKKGLKSQVPFAPFLILGTVFTMFFGKDIVSWYINFFIIL
ncbi:MAG: prepilin peptidase [Candidatus Staskawiczbacteria bacterium]|nr:prepilin peptidase [Candidatus Staskawiczbacteria bacterium]